MKFIHRRQISVPLFSSQKNQHHKSLNYNHQQKFNTSRKANISTLNYHQNKKLKNFTKNQTIDSSYANEFKYLRNNSLILSNRLTKSKFNIADTMFIKPRPLNNFQSQYKNASAENPQFLKRAVKQITKIKFQQNKDTKSKILASKRYNTSASLIIEPILKKGQSFFLSSTKVNSLSQLQPYKAKLKVSSPTIPILTSRKAQSSRKTSLLNLKIHELKQHETVLKTLIPLPIIIPQKIIVKGKGEIVSKDKIERLIDRLIQVLQLYFTMYHNKQRVTTYLRHVQGYTHTNISQLLLDQHQLVRRIENSSIIKHYFWTFNKQTQSSLKLPQFWGQQDYILFKSLTNFVMKLQLKYENQQKQKFKKFAEVDLKKHQKKNIPCVKEETSEMVMQKKKSNSQRLAYLSSSLSEQIKKNEKLIRNFTPLQDLGVKFNFRQKGRNLIMNERGKVFYTNINRRV